MRTRDWFPQRVIVAALLATGLVPSRASLAGDARDAIAREMGIDAKALLDRYAGNSLKRIEPGPQFFPQSIASGDPTSTSVVLWTRAVASKENRPVLPVRLLVFREDDPEPIVFNRIVHAREENDFCIKIRVDNLSPNTRYVYFFGFEEKGTLFVSRPGRTKTTPAPGENTTVKIAVVNCQDFTGRYYNPYLHLLMHHRNDLDAVVCLGDYIYETARVPSSQEPASDRTVDFSHPEDAINLGTTEKPILAAASLSNYRDLYKTYRSDPVLQMVHENLPMIAIWDDHEYSDDCFGDVANYFDGRIDEKDSVRRRNAERAFFEYQPIDWGLDERGLLDITDDVLFPHARIYRDFHLGKNLHLVMTDYRSFRSDGLIPEDAFPATVLVDRARLEALWGAPFYDQVGKWFLDPYIRIESRPALQDMTTQLVAILYQIENPHLSAVQAREKAEAVVRGNLSASYLNALFVSAGLPVPLDPVTILSLDRGLSYVNIGKHDIYSVMGSRQIVSKDAFEFLSRYKGPILPGMGEDVFGAAQENWIQNTLRDSTATWRILASSVSATPMVLDFTNPLIASLLPPEFPSYYRVRLALNVDQWDGFPEKREALLSMLAGVPGSMIVSGDIHASFITDHGNGVFEFTAPAISSAVAEDLMKRIVMADPLLSQMPGIEQFVQWLGVLLQLSSLDPQVSPSDILYANTQTHGYVVLEASSDNLRVTYAQIAAEHAATSFYEDPAGLEALFSTQTITFPK